MRKYRGKPARAMTDDERLHDELHMIVEGNHPFIMDVAGASYNYGLVQVHKMLSAALTKPHVNVDQLLHDIEQLKFTEFEGTRQ